MSTTTEPDCGSSSCMFLAKGGMRTNGPCRCLENAGFHGSAVMAAKQMLREVLLLRARLDAMPHDRTWTKDKPTPGEWWLSIHPDKRPAFHGADFPAVIKCHVDLMSPGFQWVVDGIEPTKHVRYDKGGDWLELDQDWFSGAKWKRVDNDPKDPFAETERTAS